jgi:O-antigen/teichoic acid export membrane protein
MGIVKKQSAINSILIYTGFVIGYINVALLLPKFLLPSEIGARETIMAFVVLLTQVGLMGNAASIIKFFPNLRHYSRHGLLGFFLLLSTFFISLSFLCLQLTSPYIIKSYQENAPIFSEYFYLIYPITLFFVFNVIFESFCRSLLLTHVPVFLKEIFQRVITSTLLIGHGLGLYDFQIFIEGFALSYGITTFILLYYLLLKGNQTLVFRWKLTKLINLKTLLLFSGFSLLTGLSAITVTQIDKLMISQLISDSATGVYAIAIYLATLIEAPKRAISMTISPLIAQSWKTNDRLNLNKIYKQVSINQQLIGSLLLGLLWINIDNVFQLIPNNDIYSTGKYVVLFFGISKLTDMTFGTNSEIIAYSKLYRFNFYSTAFLAVFTVISNNTLIPIYGINGAALASLLSLLLYNITKYLFIWKKFNLHAFNQNTIKVLGIALFLIFIFYFLPSHHHFIIDLIIKSTLFGGSYLILVYYSKSSVEYNQLIDGILNKIIKRP